MNIDEQSKKIDRAMALSGGHISVAASCLQMSKAELKEKLASIESLRKWLSATPQSPGDLALDRAKDDVELAAEAAKVDPRLPQIVSLEDTALSAGLERFGLTSDQIAYTMATAALSRRGIKSSMELLTGGTTKDHIDLGLETAEWRTLFDTVMGKLRESKPGTAEFEVLLGEARSIHTAMMECVQLRNDLFTAVNKGTLVLAMARKVHGRDAKLGFKEVINCNGQETQTSRPGEVQEGRNGGGSGTE